MAAHYLRGNAAASGCPKALLLRGETVSPEDQKLAALLDVLGVSWQFVRANEIATRNNRSGERFCVMSPARCMAALLDLAAKTGSELPDWMTKAESVYVYGFTGNSDSKSLLPFLTPHTFPPLLPRPADQPF